MVWLCILQERMNECMADVDIQIHQYRHNSGIVYHKLVLFVFDTHYVNVHSIVRNNL